MNDNLAHYNRRLPSNCQYECNICPFCTKCLSCKSSTKVVSLKCTWKKDVQSRLPNADCNNYISGIKFLRRKNFHVVISLDTQINLLQKNYGFFLHVNCGWNSWYIVDGLYFAYWCKNKVKSRRKTVNILMCHHDVASTLILMDILMYQCLLAFPTQTNYCLFIA